MRRSHKFAKPIILRDGATVDTLAEARTLMCSLPKLHQRNAHWQYAGELLSRALDRGEKYSVIDARAQFERALMAEGLI
jgi:hypothetical protein